jgi:diguanylate cyclase (GGDEF)-like protein
MQALLNWLEESTITAVAVSIALVLIIGIIDFWKGYLLSVSLFYIVPIILTAWVRGWRFGAAIAFFAASVWTGAHYIAGFPTPNHAYLLWNILMRFGVFSTVAYAFGTLKITLDSEMKSARLDPLTGIVNRREFLRALESELNRANHLGSIFSIAYFDLDNFKRLNDTSGHSEGDRAIRTVGAALQQTCRKMDIPGRLGGEEFALLLPETDEATAQGVIQRFHERFSADMKNQGWELGVSIGIVSYQGNGCSTPQLLHAADQAMYKAKKAGKNHVYSETLNSSTGQSMENYAQGNRDG